MKVLFLNRKLTIFVGCIYVKGFLGVPGPVNCVTDVEFGLFEVRIPSMVTSIGLGRMPPLPDLIVVEVEAGTFLQGESAESLSCFSHRTSFEESPVDANKIINTIDRSANSHPARDAVERFSDLSAMTSWP